MEIMDKADMTNCKPASTPVDTSPKLGVVARPHVANPTENQSLTGTQQYLTFTRPDMAYDVQQICLHMDNTRDQHLAVVKHVLRYIKGMLSHGLYLYPSSPTSMLAYMDADWAGALTPVAPFLAFVSFLETTSSLYQ